MSFKSPGYVVQGRLDPVTTSLLTTMLFIISVHGHLGKSSQGSLVVKINLFWVSNVSYIVKKINWLWIFKVTSEVCEIMKTQIYKMSYDR